ncbi:hypothetical protein [Brevundimonas sp.]|uniref:hypothetical protein n=1 Tax=Brevundimonas sp. TaxID=1871086 RepID=UPI002D6663CB|nr:hypothetical protein [Brevundimonas sp.]HYC68867.1 hypothetical protein [Brevundimonas sp.]
MKIEPRLVHFPVPSIAADKSVGGGFGLLMSPASPIDSNACAVSFQARGMFGRHGATATDRAGGQNLILTIPPLPQAETPRPPPESAPNEPTPSSASRFQSLRLPEPPPRPEATALAEKRGRPDAGMAGMVSKAGERSRAARPEGSSAARPRPMPPSPHVTRRVSLAPTDEPDAAALIVRALDLDPQEIAEFRIRAQALLRDRGLALDKVRINGEDHPVVDASGGRSQAWR